MTVGDIDGSVSGASSLDIEIKADNVDLGISGASKVEGNLTAKDMVFDLSGASRVVLDGSGNNSEVEASGASQVILSDFSVIDADISLSGASTCKIYVTGKIHIDLSGASKLTYIGNPSLGKIDISGGSTVNDETED